MTNWVRIGSDVLTALVGIALLGVIGWQHLAPAPGLGDDLVGTELTVPTVDFSAGERTLVMVLRSDCIYCRESMPFYRRLLERDRPGVQTVVAAPPYDTGIGDYLASEGVTPESVVFVEPEVLPVSGTPTLSLADADGVVTRVWLGLLNDELEFEVIRMKL